MLNNITVFDFETTGLDPVNDRVIEIAAIRRINGEIVGSFQTLIKIDFELPPKITEITGITMNDLESNGIDEREAFIELLELIGDSTIVAHNAAFDMNFLHNTMIRLFGYTFKNDFIDTVTISRERFIYPHKLVDMLDKLGIKLEGAHRALTDVEGTLTLLDRLNELKPINYYINKIGYLRKYGEPSWLPEHATSFATENQYGYLRNKYYK